MGRKLVLGLWSLLCVTSLASSKAVISCTDQDTCKHLRIVTSNSNDIPAELRRHKQVESIDLHGNLLESFSGNDIGSARQLKALNLSYNLLKSDTLLNIGSQLEEIDITYNQWNYVQVPRSVKKFVAVRNKLIEVTFVGNNVEQLILSKNRLSKIPEIGGQYNLKELDMSCNEISEVNFDNFANLRKIETINLANNRIYQTTGNSPLNSLRSLDLSNNILTIIDESMDSVSNVKELNLRNNQIVVITAPKIAAQKRFSSLRSVDFTENDWDCNSLEKFFEKRYLTSVQDTSCSNGNFGSQGLCCTESQSPFADRVIRYNQRNYEALQNSSSIREHGVNCTNYKPSPCDGDDNEVYRVANAAASDTQLLISQNKEQLQGTLDKQKQTLHKKEEEKRTIEAENANLQVSLDELLAYIREIYQNEKLQGATDPSKQLKAIFDNRDEANKHTNELVTEEERKLQNLLTDISRNEEDLQELNDKKARLLEDMSTRNQTLLDYNKKIDELNKKLGRS